MALEIKTSLKMSTSLVITPQLRQAIKILQVSRAELEQLVEEELEENPVLEEAVSEEREAAATEEEEAPRTEERLETNGEAEEWPETPQRETTNELEPDNGLNAVDWDDYFRNHQNDRHDVAAPRDYDDEKRSSFENTLVRAQSLTDHLLWQLQMNDLDEEEQSVTAMLIGNMDDDGYIQLPIEEIAFQAGKEFETVERALKRIQELDPPGVGARDLRECLRLQLRARGAEGSLADRIIAEHLPMLEGKRFDKIAKDLGVAVEEVATAANAIATLEPKPGRNFGEGDVRYITPDVFVHKVGDEYVVTLNEDGLPRLRVSSYYRQVLEGAGGTEARKYVQDKMKSALWLIKSIQQRQNTLFKVTSSIVKFQRAFLDRGIAHLRPLVLKDVALDIEMHESTVSRATANKYVHTAQGIFELKFFFTSSISTGSGEDVSSESVKDRIKAIVSAEDTKHPLSDQHIAEMLDKEGVKVARRTVAKYREMMNILPSSKRRQVF
ncbi:MAG: RNA polymerase factor sigma-54 [Deltaproteobacteria bacterium]|nr:RNA polymerase factor sigma-54 [Deltaproteobacteria bacterium]